MGDIETMDLQRLVIAQQKAQVFLNGFLSPDPARRALLGTQLRPREEDWATVFVEESVPRFKKYYQGLLLANVTPAGKPGQIQIRLAAAQAEHLVFKNPLSDRFPGGYKKIAHLFQPRTIWLSWKFTEPGKVTGMAYDGLVFLPDDRFVWFPKPWRVS